MANEKIYHVVCCTDDKYIQHCGIMLCSLLENNKNNKFDVHILIDEINDSNRIELIKLIKSYGSNCVFHKVDSSKLDGAKFREEEPLTKAAYYRLLLGSILNESILKVLYLDCDIIVVNEVISLYELQLDGYALAAVQDVKGTPYSELHRNQLRMSYSSKYFNSGVMMINLDYWRKNNVEPLLIEFSIRERYVFFHDQDALNYLFKDKWYCISPKWNYMCLKYLQDICFNNINDKIEYLSHPHIIHYTSRYKPWKDINFLPKGKEYRKYKQKTIWKNLPLETVRGNKFRFYMILWDIKIFNWMYQSPLLSWGIYKILRDLVRFFISIFTWKKYYRL